MIRNCQVVLLALIGIGTFSGPAISGDAPEHQQLTTIFGQTRPIREDVIQFRNKDVLRGHVLNETIRIVTQYGALEVPLDRCAGVSFEEARVNAESVVTVNHNRFTGIITDRVIRFRIGSSQTEIPIRKERILVILLGQRADETDFLKDHGKSDLFLMANGDLLSGEAVEREIKVDTDQGTLSVAFDELAQVEMQAAQGAGALITKVNGETVRGTLATNEITLDLEIGLKVPTIYRTAFTKILVDKARQEIAARLGVERAGPGDSAGGVSAGSAGKVITNSIGMQLRLLPPGEFVMGSPPEELGREKDESQQPVTLTGGFYMGVIEVTQGQWQAVMGKNPSRFKGDDRQPVEKVSWNDCQNFCKKLGKKEGKTYRLPTEAEWEYACRAGTTTPFNTGETISTTQANYDGDAAYGSGRKGVDREQTVPAGSFSANAWGLHDMHGNVWEWCSDWHGKYPQVAQTDPKGPLNGTSRVLRGGSWYYAPEDCRSANRFKSKADKRYDDFGLRVVLDTE